MAGVRGNKISEEAVQFETNLPSFGLLRVVTEAADTTDSVYNPLALQLCSSPLRLMNGGVRQLREDEDSASKSLLVDPLSAAAPQSATAFSPFQRLSRCVVGC
jgi:hypothetical protein